MLNHLTLISIVVLVIYLSQVESKFYRGNRLGQGSILIQNDDRRRRLNDFILIGGKGCGAPIIIKEGRRGIARREQLIIIGNECDHKKRKVDYHPMEAMEESHHMPHRTAHYTHRPLMTHDYSYNYHQMHPADYGMHNYVDRIDYMFWR